MPRLNLGVVLLLAILNLTNAERVSYRDYAVIRCSPETQEQLELLRSLQSNTVSNKSLVGTAGAFVSIRGSPI